VGAFQMSVCPGVVGGGKRFFPDGVRLDLGLLEERRCGNGVLILRYGGRGAARGLAAGVKSSEILPAYQWLAADQRSATSALASDALAA
jgi:hypothetical protein